MSMRQQLRLATSPAPDGERGERAARRAAREEREHLAATLDQLERAELYVVAALGLQSADPDRRRLLEDLRAQVAAVRRTLVRPSVVD